MGVVLLQTSNNSRLRSRCAIGLALILANGLSGCGATLVTGGLYGIMEAAFHEVLDGGLGLTRVDLQGRLTLGNTARIVTI